MIQNIKKRHAVTTIKDTYIHVVEKMIETSQLDGGLFHLA